MEDMQRFGVTEEEARGSVRCRRMICCGQHLKEKGFWSRSLTIFRSLFFFSLTLFHVQGYFQLVGGLANLKLHCYYRTLKKWKTVYKDLA